jgi:hypothetical protein
MRQWVVSLSQSATGVANRATSLFAAACAAFAAMQELSQRAILPTWIWWCAALALLFWSGIALQWQLLQQSKHQTLEPDRKLSEMITQILGAQDPESFGASTQLSQFFSKIGRPPVWISYRSGVGKMQKPTTSTSIPLSQSQRLIGVLRKLTSWMACH